MDMFKKGGNLTIFRVKKSKEKGNFTVIDNEYLRDNKLSWKAKGLLTYFLSLPDDWNIRLTEIQKWSNVGEYSLKSTFDELVKNGYAKRFRKRDNKGVIRGWGINIYERKNVKNDKENLDDKKSVSGKSTEVNFPLVDNHVLLNTNNTKYLNKLNTNNTNISNYKYISNGDNDHINLVINEWEKIPELEKVSDRKKDIRFIISKYGIDNLLKVIENIKFSKWLRGLSNNGTWRVSLNWIKKKDNFNKILNNNFNRDMTESEVKKIEDEQALINQLSSPIIAKQDS